MPDSTINYCCMVVVNDYLFLIIIIIMVNIVFFFNNVIVSRPRKWKGALVNTESNHTYTCV